MGVAACYGNHSHNDVERAPWAYEARSRGLIVLKYRTMMRLIIGATAVFGNAAA
jgi:hypothetical protein